MTDRELAAKAEAAFKRATVLYSTYAKNLAAGKYPDPLKTAWGEGLDGLAQIQGVTPDPPAAGMYRLTLTPNWNNGADSNDVKNNYQAVWVYSGPEIYVPPNGRDPYRCLLLDPRYKDSKGRAGCDEWWIILRRGWPASFDPARHGDYGTFDNCHNLAGDAGSQENHDGGIGWSWGDPVSALALDWLNGAPAPVVALNNAKSGGLELPLPVPSRDTIHEYAVRFRAGRTDGSTVRPGEVEILADGKPVILLPNLNTVQRAKGPDGNWYVQRWMSAPWSGYYTRNLLSPSGTLFQLPGVGRTLAEARADKPVDVGGTFATQAWNGKQPNDGPPTLAVPA